MKTVVDITPVIRPFMGKIRYQLLSPDSTLNFPLVFESKSEKKESARAKLEKMRNEAWSVPHSEICSSNPALRSPFIISSLMIFLTRLVFASRAALPFRALFSLGLFRHSYYRSGSEGSEIWAVGLGLKHFDQPRKGLYLYHSR